MRQFQAQNIYLKFPLTRMCYHAAVSKPLPQTPIDGNVLSRSRDYQPYSEIFCVSSPNLPSEYLIVKTQPSVHLDDDDILRSLHVLGVWSGCHTGNGEKLSCSQAEAGQAIKSAVS